ncbi:MAG: hydroxysqualene dehydroxylase HpnE [Pseudomonadota bacterium]
MAETALAVAPADDRATVHVVGAGLAGLSAALGLAQAGRRVVIHEAGRQAGGRCRSFHDPRLGCEIDNGNHLVLSGNRSVRAYLKRIGAEDKLLPEPGADFDFVDLADGARWRVSLNRGPLPWWVLSPKRRIPGTALADYLAGARLALAGADTTVAEALPRRGALWSRFWEPLTLAAINTTPERASARLLWRVLAETFAKGATHARPMLAPEGLGHALVAPALACLAREGIEIRYARTLRTLERDGPRATALCFNDGTETLGPGDGIVLALPPWRLKAILPEIGAADTACSILNAFFRLPEEALPALAETPKILGTLSSTTHWIFRRGDVVSLTVSASDALGLDSADPEQLIPHLWDETKRALGLPATLSYAAVRLNKERRATFDQSPAGVRQRPKPTTSLANLVLAGDATDTGLPATIEGAIRSGETAARLLCGQKT